MTETIRPQSNLDTAYFWQGAAAGELRIQRCTACGSLRHPPGPACWRCRSFDVAPEKVSGRATVAAFTVDRQPWIPGFEPPYIVAIVEIAEEPDVRLTTNVVDVEPADMRIGLEVEVFFEDWTGLSGGEDTRVWIPLFRPATR